MGKISVEISDELENKIRKYIAEHYWKNPFGKLSEIVEEALKLWIEKKIGAEKK
jgi:Arc/MetJ-type ribon-helix-helix transcriptional regulator